MSETLLEKHPKAVGITSGIGFLGGVGLVGEVFSYLVSHVDISGSQAVIGLVGVASMVSGGFFLGKSVVTYHEQKEEMLAEISQLPMDWSGRWHVLSSPRRGQGDQQTRMRLGDNYPKSV